jgi:hypothetical protein
VTLYDFKERISKQLDINKHFKFFFKSQDPEFGYLKEESKIFRFYFKIYLSN